MVDVGYGGTGLVNSLCFCFQSFICVHTPIVLHWEQFRVQYLAQGYFDKKTNHRQITDLLITGSPN